MLRTLKLSLFFIFSLGLTIYGLLLINKNPDDYLGKTVMAINYGSNASRLTAGKVIGYYVSTEEESFYNVRFESNPGNPVIFSIRKDVLEKYFVIKKD